VADTFAGRIHVEWDNSAPVTPFGQMPFFIEFLKQGGPFDGMVADCPALFESERTKKSPKNPTPSARFCGRCWPHIGATRTDDGALRHSESTAPWG
jgi:hypothetical protein